MRSLAAYIHYILALIPWWHWAMIAVLAVAAFVLARRRRTVYGAVVQGITVSVPFGICLEECFATAKRRRGTGGTGAPAVRCCRA